MFIKFKRKLITLLLAVFVVSLYVVNSRGLVVIDDLYYIENAVLIAMAVIVFVTYVYIVALLLGKRYSNQQNFNHEDVRLHTTLR